MPCSHQMEFARDHSDYLSPDLIHNQWKLTMDVAPTTHQGLINAARDKFNELLELPEHSLCKLYGEIVNLETGQYSLVPIINAVMKVDTRGRPRANHSQGKRKRSPEGRWKSDLEIAKKAQRRRVSKCSHCLKPGHKITTCPRRLSRILPRQLDDFEEVEGDSDVLISDSEDTNST